MAFHQQMRSAPPWPPPRTETFKDRFVRGVSPPYSRKAIMIFLLALAAIVVVVIAVPVATTTASSNSAAVSPQVASVSIIGNLTDPAVSRDSCVSTRIGNRALWVCRDTQTYNASSDESVLPLLTNSAAWTTFTSSGSPQVSSKGPVGAGSTGSNTILEMTGGSPTTYPAYFPIPNNACPVSGHCSDNTRWTVWPSSAPVITKQSSTKVVAYSFIPKGHYENSTLLNGGPPTSLYRSTYTISGGSTSSSLPTASLVAESFWKRGSIAYGVYGSLVVNGTLYLYGKTGTSPPGVALAKVAVGSVEDSSQYSYYVNGAWTSTMPSRTSSSANLANAGTGGQGGFYYSTYFNSYMWIGGNLYAGSADFYVSTAPSPEGPWITPYQIYSGANGDSTLLPSYSCVPNPALLKSQDQNGIYLSWTQSFEASTYGAYVTPLVYVKWK